jgi:hypothetical protein
MKQGMGLRRAPTGDFTVAFGHGHPLVTIIILQSCALNAEFQDFTVRFHKFHYFAHTNERGDRG